VIWPAPRLPHTNPLGNARLLYSQPPLGTHFRCHKMGAGRYACSLLSTPCTLKC
jgi:hypothetical protein